jgi:7-alpha-hydroxysteroid dehydrogenase
MKFSVEGKTAIITGAANGIGLAIARHFVDQGANVVFADMDEARLLDELGDDAEAENIAHFAGDLREKLTVANLLSMTIDRFDRVDILVNASRQIIPTDPLDADDDTMQALLQQNVLCPMRVTQAVARRMIKQAKANEEDPSGAIVNLSSISAHLTHPELVGYSVSTAALDQLTRSLAVAYAPYNIRVNAVGFGSVMSASLQNQLREDDAPREAILKATPLGRIASATELVDTVQFLASDASSFMTGQIVTSDGGRSLIDPAQVSAH